MQNAENRQYIGRNSSGKNTKIYALVNGNGQIMDFLPYGGWMYEAKVAVELLRKVDIPGSHILADKAYGTASTREYITQYGCKYTIPPHRNIKESHGNMIGNDTSVVM